jgi:hypothetical protein
MPFLDGVCVACRRRVVGYRVARRVALFAGHLAAHRVESIAGHLEQAVDRVAGRDWHRGHAMVAQNVQIDYRSVAAVPAW